MSTNDDDICEYCKRDNHEMCVFEFDEFVVESEYIECCCTDWQEAKQ